MKNIAKLFIKICIQRKLWEITYYHYSDKRCLYVNILDVNELGWLQGAFQDLCQKKGSNFYNHP